MKRLACSSTEQKKLHHVEPGRRTGVGRTRRAAQPGGKARQTIRRIRKEIKTIHWFRGGDQKKAIRLVRAHLRLLVPFGFKLKLGVRVVTSTEDASLVRDTIFCREMDYIRDEVMSEVFRLASESGRTEIWRTALGTAWEAARTLAWAAAKNIHWDYSWDVAYSAGRDAGRDAECAAASNTVSDLLRSGDPFAPIWKCWKLGAWPIGVVGDKFVLYCPKRRGPGAYC